MSEGIYTLPSEDELVFAAEDRDTGEKTPLAGNWKLMIVDDEPEVHDVTKLVLHGFVFEGKSLEFVSAFSAREAQQLLERDSDIAVILLDVVMEREDSGLKLVQYIRDELGNKLVRIILRTGQPGQAPELKVIIDYDINDYKEKTELTSQKLYSAIVTSLRSYRDLQTINVSKQGLEKIIQSSANIFEFQSMKKFVAGILTQLTSLLNLGANTLFCRSSGLAVVKNGDGFDILAATGDFSPYTGQKVERVLPDAICHHFEQACRQKSNIYHPNGFVIFFQSLNGSVNLIYFEGAKKLNDLDKYFTEIFCANVSIAFDNLFLNKEIENTQKEIIFTLGEIAEARSKETGHHVKRVAEFSKLLALKYGLPEDEAELIRMASPMHDVGKLAVPDRILNKPGQLTPEEFEIMKSHSLLGFEMLKNSNRRIMETAAVIALQHHEKFNGTGYPYGLKGEAIHLHGRITAVADVFDAIGSDRVYKKAWDVERILELFQMERGEHFDPMLVDIFFENLPEIIRIKESFPDK